MDKDSRPRVPPPSTAFIALLFMRISLVLLTTHTLSEVCIMITDEVPKDQRAYEACPQLHSGQVVWLAPEAPKPGTSAPVLTPDTTLLPVHSGLNPLLQSLLCHTVSGLSGLPGKADSVYP